MSERDAQAANRRLIRRLVLATLVMFGFGFAMVPLYNVFCDITGLNGKTGRAVEAELDLQVDESRTVTVEFIATVNGEMPWDFRPVVTRMQVHPGKVYAASYRAENRSGRAVAGQAVPSVTPGEAALHFVKTECFCFTRQELKAGQVQDMPLRFVVDRRLPKEINTVTLSYTFFEAQGAAMPEIANIGGGGADARI